MPSPGIEPATFGFTEQHFNQLNHPARTKGFFRFGLFFYCGKAKIHISGHSPLSHFQVCSSPAPSTFAALRNRHRCLSPDPQRPQLKLRPHQHQLSIAPPPAFLTHRPFPFLPVNLAVLAPRKWDLTKFVLLCLAYFTLRNVFSVHPCCSKDQSGCGVSWISFLSEAEQHSIVWLCHMSFMGFPF